MFGMEEVRGFLSLPQPVLSVYLDVNPAKPSNRGPDPEYLTWLHAAAKGLADRLAPGNEKLFRKQVERVEAFLRERIAPRRGLLIFAGPDTWESLPLQVPVENELRWGRPAISQLARELSRHKPYGVAVVDLAGVRFFRWSMGELTGLDEKKFVVDISNWRKKDMGKASRKIGTVSLQKSRGADRDTFERRMDERYRRLNSETARQTVELCQRHGLAALFLVGETRRIEPIARAFPNDFCSRVVLVEEDLGGIVSPELERRLEPAIARWETMRESDEVDSLLRGGRGAVLGLGRTIMELQRGRIRALVVSAGLDGEFLQCASCSRADLSESAVCPHCGSVRTLLRLREVLPELAWKHGAELEFVTGLAGERLAEAGGVGGWLRQPKRAGVRHATPRAG